MSLSPEEERVIRARQKSRSVVLGVILGFMVILFYAITIAKMGARP